MRRPADLLKYWQVEGAIHESPDAGLINGTWMVGSPPQAVLQWVNPIFAPQIQLDIDLFSQRLEAKGLHSPRLIPTRTGNLWVDDDESGCWRMLQYVPGSTHHRLKEPGMAFEAGRLVGQMHSAVAGWEPRRYAPTRNAHNTAARMTELQLALAQSPAHPLRDQAEPAALAILEAWFSWQGATELPKRNCHGDLKVSNIRFDREGKKAIALIDLDTVGPMALAAEMGDAWRSWCNPAGEDDPETARFDLPLFEASLRGFTSSAPELCDQEWENLTPGIERICLELAARFCADALNNSYFKEDLAAFPATGTHNLHRALCQLALSRSVHRHRSQCEALVSTLRP